MDATCLVEHLLAETRVTATTHAVRRLLERRPDLTPPGGLPVLVPREEDTRFVLDRLAMTAWIARQVEQAAELEASTALLGRATWAEIAQALRCTEVQARARYGHLAPAPAEPASEDTTPPTRR